MRSSLSFSLDSTEDAKLIEWLSSQPNRSAAVRDALYVAMQGAPEVATAPLLAATRRIEAELNELKKLVLDAAGGFVQFTQPEELKPTGTTRPPAPLPGFLASDFPDEPPRELPSDVLANLRKLKK